MAGRGRLCDLDGRQCSVGVNTTHSPNTRHDIDRVLPRSGKEIFDLNRMMAKRMIDLFGKKFPVVPTLGNNDIYPHNILDAGPNRVTQEFLT